MAKDKVKEIITNIFSLIESHGEDYVDKFIKNLVASGKSDEIFVCDFIIHKVRAHYKLSQKSLISAYCTGVIRDAKIVIISIIDTLINISNQQAMDLLGINNTKGLLRIRKQAVELSDNIKHHKAMKEVICNVALETKDKFKL